MVVNADHICRDSASSGLDDLEDRERRRFICV